MRVQLLVVLIFPGVGCPVFADEPPKKREHPRSGWNLESEAAVSRGLAWLARQQQKDGSWKFDGSSKEQVAATGMALLPFLAANQTPANGKYMDQVANGIGWLMGKNLGNGLGTTNMYAHALATMALCEAAWRTKDAKIMEKAKAAVAYIVGAQGRNGSWGYTGPAPSEGDTSILGMQIEALTVAKRAGIEFDAKVFEMADKFLVGVSSEIESKYGYREKGMSQTLTPVALLSRNAMGTISDRAYGKGIDFLKQFPPQKGYFDMYYYYYATQVVFQAGGDNWHKFWNPKMRDMLLDLQDKKKGPTDGSWAKDQGFIGTACGRIGTTALAVLTLEVYYRDIPLYKRDNGGLEELER